MAVYKVIELVGTSTESWENAARSAVERASQSLRDLRVAEVVELDCKSPMARSKRTEPRSRCRSNSRTLSSLRGRLHRFSRSSDA
jgi:flavin-binding protein dodecin